MRHPTAQQLRPIDLFDELGDPELESWAHAAELREVPAGEIIAEQGTAAPAVQLLLAGAVELVVHDPDGREEPIGENTAPTWLGAIPAITGGVSAVRVKATEPVTVATIPRDDFVELVLAHRPVFARVMAQVRPVVGRITALQQNRERLASLGTMAAGLAHELNNPAAAARRAACDLAEALEVLSSTIGRFVESGVEREEAQQLVALQTEAVKHAAERGPLDALDAADAEDELLTALEELDVAEAWDLTEPLMSAGADAQWLDRVAALAGPATGAALKWVAVSITARQLAAELAESTERMSSLVGAVKSYAYMDRGGVVEVDIHEGLETTLTVLSHKLKHTEIGIERNYDRAIPKLTIHGSELNQVWTNLLDNAIDALDGRGTISISTRLDGGCVQVDIGDDGPGIPDDARQHIFDPFFTTKEVGRGTGLGLDTARRIVADRHRGSLTFDTSPQGTVFHIRLPLKTA